MTKNFGQKKKPSDIYPGWVRVSVADAKGHLSGLLLEMEEEGRGVVITRHGHDVAAVVPISAAAMQVQADHVGDMRRDALLRGVDPVEQVVLQLYERALRGESLLPEEEAMVARLQAEAARAARKAFLEGLRREIGGSAVESVPEDRALLGSNPSAGTGSARGAA